jgi:hypothetical protein
MLPSHSFNMQRQRSPKGASARNIPLQQPDRSRPGISQETLFDIAEKRGLLKETNGVSIQADDATTGEINDPPIGRFEEAILWSISLAMLHFTFDVLVQHQYAVEISWRKVVTTSLQALGGEFCTFAYPLCLASMLRFIPVFLVLCYTLHPHSSPSPLFPRLPPRYQAVLSQLLFFVASITSGCYLIYITNKHGYQAVMKRAPPVGCIWVWSVIELDLKWALASLTCCGMFLWWGGYSYG